MLKIKDNVDLKELEKYGFKVFSKTSNIYDKELAHNEEINIYSKDEISIALDGWESSNLDTLYDLINADLVEKVKE